VFHAVAVVLVTAAIANHTIVSLARASLMDRLRREVEEREHLGLHDALTGPPIHEMKIDKSFVPRVAADPRDRAAGGS
jgi:hypothetical protein